MLNKLQRQNFHQILFNIPIPDDDRGLGDPRSNFVVITNIESAFHKLGTEFNIDCIMFSILHEKLLILESINAEKSYLAFPFF